MAESRCAGCFQAVEPNQACAWCASTPVDVGYHDLPAGTVVAGRYVIGRVLGRGGFGVTYLAWRETPPGRVAIKEYLPQTVAFRDRDGTTVVPASVKQTTEYDLGLADFLDEGRRLAKFHDHPHIIRVLDYVTANGTGYLVMEFCAGHTLTQHLQQHGGRLRYAQMLEIMMPVLSALESVHAENIFHRDVSPDNILVTDEGVKLIDFGAARGALSERSVSFSTIVRQDYAPPEQYSRRGRQGPWSDIYATAATMYHVLTGAPPPPAPTRIERDDLVAPRAEGADTPRHADRAILQALSLRREERPATVGAFRAMLTGAGDRLAGIGGISRPKWVAAAIALAALGVVGLAVLISSLNKPVERPQILAFRADPSVIETGRSSMLHWQVSGAGEVRLSPSRAGEMLPTQGSAVVTPVETTTYTLIAKKDDQIVTSEIAVNVTTPPPSAPPASPPPEDPPRRNTPGSRGQKTVARKTPMTPSQQAMRALNVSKSTQKWLGYEEAFDARADPIARGVEQRYRFYLKSGDYMFLANGDSATVDIDLALLGLDGSVVARDRTSLTNDSVSVVVRVVRGGSYTLVVTVPECTARSCWVATTALFRPRTP